MYVTSSHPRLRRESLAPYYSQRERASATPSRPPYGRPTREFVAPYYSQRERDYRAPTQRGNRADRVPTLSTSVARAPRTLPLRGWPLGS